MAIAVSEYVNVRERARTLGCREPVQFAILPRNFPVASCREELLHESAATTVRALWQQSGMVETPIEEAEHHFGYVHDKASSTWDGPVIFFSAAVLKGMPEVVAGALGVITNYLAVSLKEERRRREVALGVVLEGDAGACRLVSYRGDVEGLRLLPGLVYGAGARD